MVQILSFLETDVVLPLISGFCNTNREMIQPKAHHELPVFLHNNNTHLSHHYAPIKFWAVYQEHFE